MPSHVLSTIIACLDADSNPKKGFPFKYSWESWAGIIFFMEGITETVSNKGRLLTETAGKEITLGVYTAVSVTGEIVTAVSCPNEI